jgi:phosphopantothenoylcysteine decarboxylase/phosphopantothenate--cysteine ligase
MPQAVAGDAAGQAVRAQPLEADPLAGQPAFDADPEHRPLYGRHVLITAGPTWEPIDPVRYIANRSSGKQGYAIAAMAAAAGARVTLVSGPVHLPTPVGVDRVNVESADEMAAAVKAALPADAAFMVAAVADWRTRDVAQEKMKKRGSAPPALILTENPDILAGIAAGKHRKRKRKGADWIIANNVTDTGDGGVMGGDVNEVTIVSSSGVEKLAEMPKEDVARELVLRAAEALADIDADN